MPEIWNPHPVLDMLQVKWSGYGIESIRWHPLALLSRPSHTGLVKDNERFDLHPRMAGWSLRSL